MLFPRLLAQVQLVEPGDIVPGNVLLGLKSRSFDTPMRGVFKPGYNGSGCRMFMAAFQSASMTTLQRVQENLRPER